MLGEEDLENEINICNTNILKVDYKNIYINSCRDCTQKSENAKAFLSKDSRR